MNLSVKSGIVKRIVLFLSPAVFGVYLLHLNTYTTKWFWRGLLCPDKIDNPALLLAHHLAVVISVYLLCTMVEKIRLLLLEKNPLMRKLFENVDRGFERFLDKKENRGG